jgi:predicted amidohydrolase YtcJ
VQTLFVNAHVTTLDPQHPSGRCLLVSDGNVEQVLDTRPKGLGGAVKVVDCHGGEIVPGFHDTHVHLTATGLISGVRDLTACRDVPSILARVEKLSSSEKLIYAGNFDESKTTDRRLPTRQELDGASHGKPALLSRVDGHSCVANSEALALLGIDLTAQGVERDSEGASTGKLSGAISYAAQYDFVRGLPASALRRSDREAADAALAAGITTLHNVIEGDAAFEELAEIYIDNAVLSTRVISKSCTTSVAKAKRLGGRIFGGDIFVDGSIGSRTAAVGESYVDANGRGLLYLKRDQLAELFAEAAEAGLSLGVHAIGDEAIEQAIAAWEIVAAKRGSLEGLRPSIDHFEIARPDHITRAADVGLLLSMQPAFDYLWGGEGGMYEERLGAERAKGMNLFRTAKRTGCTICGGSDSPVTKLSALLGIHSLVNHHVPEERFSIEEALGAYTHEAAKLSFTEEQRGRLRPGMVADFVVLEKRLQDVPKTSIKDMRVMMTVIDGEIRYNALK